MQSCHDMDTLGMYMDQFPKLDPFMNDDMKDLWDSDLDQVIFTVSREQPSRGLAGPLWPNRTLG